MAAPRSTLYRIELIEEVRRQLRCLPEPKIAEVSKLEVVRALAPDIEELQKAGHTIETIASTLSGLGVELTKATLKTYLGKLKSAGHRGKGRRRLGTGGRPATSSETAHRVAAGGSAHASAMECDAPSVDIERIRSIGKDAAGGSADDGKENHSVTPQEIPRKPAASVSARPGVQAAEAAGVTANADASSRSTRLEGQREEQQGTPDGSSGPEVRSELAHPKSEKPALRGSAIATPSERPAWSFVPRQDSNDI